LSEIPNFVQGSRLLVEAYELAVDAHHGARRRNDTDIDHPAAVGALLHEAGYDDKVVAAGILHDVVEDTDTELSEIEDRFGPEVGDLVAVLTEDASIEPYEERKAEHRARVARHSSRAGAIYAADKLAKVRALRRDGEGVPDRKLDHYRGTFEVLRDSHPGVPFLAELGTVLRALEADRQEAGRR
jgi:(p)ppGpp synthase/HD superfamily hydrolase